MADPFTLFDEWLAEAIQQEPNDATAMALATMDADGSLGVRMVLLKGVDSEKVDGVPPPHRGFLFYTNLQSRKGVAISHHRQVSLLFHWKSLRRQIRIDGVAHGVSDAEADEYFRTRPRGSQIGAWSSDQSRPMADHLELERRVAKDTIRFGVGNVPRPPIGRATASSPPALSSGAVASSGCTSVTSMNTSPTRSKLGGWRGYFPEILYCTGVSRLRNGSGRS